MADEDPELAAFLKALGGHARRLRKARGFTQLQIGGRADLSSDTIRRLEQGSFSASIDTLRKLCAGLDLPLSTFFTALEVGDDQLVELETLVELLRKHPEIPVTALIALVEEWVSARGGNGSTA